ncbi:MAG: hypothetical protein ACU83P_07830 [Gammaproteobacteria bacterium]
MKKILLISISALFVTACAEKTEYETAVLEEMKTEQDVKDYHIDPEIMAECVIDTTTEKMPGFYDLDPYRRQAYKNYTKMLTMSKSTDPKKTLDELRKDFGSPKALAEAHSNFTESMMNCYSAMMIRSEPEADDNKAKPEEEKPGAEPKVENAPQPDEKTLSVPKN